MAPVQLKNHTVEQLVIVKNRQVQFILRYSPWPIGKDIKPMQYTFIFGKVAIMVRYWEERYDETDGGARVDVRMVESYEGEGHRPGASGYRILPVSEGGIWRIDLQHRLDSDDHEPRFHHHPEFQYGDVGPRVFDHELAEDPVGWTEQRLLILPALLEEAGLAHLGATIDTKQLAAAMPMIRQAIEMSLQPN